MAEFYNDNKGKNIKKAVLYPFNKVAHAIVRFRDMLDYEIVGVVDLTDNIGRDTGDILGTGKTGIVISDDIEKTLEECDTLVLTDEVNENWFGVKFEKLDLKNKMWRVVEAAVDMGKNVYSIKSNLIYTAPEHIRDKIIKAQENGTIISFANMDDRGYKDIMEDNGEWVLPERNAPVVGVFGTSPHQGKMSTQMTIKRELLNRGMKVGHIGTEPSSYLLRCDDMFENMPPVSRDVYLFRHVLKELDKEKKDCIIIGGQSGIVPFSLGVNSPCFTLPSIKYLFATNPDFYVLMINHTDTQKHIYDSIAGLEALGKNEVVAMVLPDKKGVGKNEWHETIYEQVSKEEMESKKKEIEELFEVPVVDIVTKSGSKRLGEIIMKRIEAVNENKKQKKETEAETEY